MNKFINGQNVKCIYKCDEEDDITIGNAYIIMYYGRSLESDSKSVYIIDDSGDICWYPEKCFE